MMGQAKKTSLGLIKVFQTLHNLKNQVNCLDLCLQSLFNFMSNKSMVEPLVAIEEFVRFKGLRLVLVPILPPGYMGLKA
jgi:hypothetical protein